MWKKLMRNKSNAWFKQYFTEKSSVHVQYTYAHAYLVILYRIGRVPGLLESLQLI